MRLRGKPRKHATLPRTRGVPAPPRARRRRRCRGISPCQSPQARSLGALVEREGLGDATGLCLSIAPSKYGRFISICPPARSVRPAVDCSLWGDTNTCVRALEAILFLDSLLYLPSADT